MLLKIFCVSEKEIFFPEIHILWISHRIPSFMEDRPGFLFFVFTWCRQSLRVGVYYRQTDIASRWIHRESSLMITLSSKAAGLTVLGRSMILPGTINSWNFHMSWMEWQERVSEVVPTGRTPGWRPQSHWLLSYQLFPKSHWQERPPETVPPLTASGTERWIDGIVPGKSWNDWEPWGQRLCE